MTSKAVVGFLQMFIQRFIIVGHDKVQNTNHLGVDQLKNNIYNNCDFSQRGEGDRGKLAHLINNNITKDRPK